MKLKALLIAAVILSGAPGTAEDFVLDAPITEWANCVESAVGRYAMLRLDPMVCMLLTYATLAFLAGCVSGVF